MIEVIRPGALTTVQDLGRPGWAHLGVPPSGAADTRSLRLANRLLANPEELPALETTLVGPRLRTDADAVVAITGATVDARVGDHGVPMNAPVYLKAGDALEIGPAAGGLRTYVAVRGGFACPLTLGSAATDLLTGLGPSPLRAGDRLAVGPTPADFPAVDVAPTAPLAAEPILELVFGPRADWFTAAARRLLTGSSYRVSDTSNRVGIRLLGPELSRAREGELKSEGMTTGALQVPPAGTPIILLADHPTTGGYPVIAVLRRAELPIAGQLRPGQRVRFRESTAARRP
ncbi:MAG: biotin-dependent carboxyltransferase family protein [Solirubrobacteraceae bacterium]